MKFAHVCLLAGGFVLSTAAFAETSSPLAPGVKGPSSAAEESKINDADIPVEFIRPRDFIFSVGYHTLNLKPRVVFGNIGSLNSSFPVPSDPTSGIRSYDDGVVFADSAREEEASADARTNTGRYLILYRDSNNNVVTVNNNSQPVFAKDKNGNQYQDTNGQPIPGVVIRDALSYEANYTRLWQYTGAYQVAPDRSSVSFHVYNMTPTGETVSGTGATSKGASVQLERIFRRISPKLEVGFKCAVSLGDINVKGSGTVFADLHRVTDTYAVHPGSTIPALPADGTPYTAPTYEDLDFIDPTDGSALTIDANRETTTTISSIGTRTVDTITNGAIVTGTWQVKGAYYMLQFGPTVRAHLHEKFAVSGSAGLVASYVGTSYRTLAESVELVGIGITRKSVLVESSSSNALLGYYAEANLEWWLTDVTGFYAGMTYASFPGSYTQKLGPRTAKISLGAGSGIQFGISTRF